MMLPGAIKQILNSSKNRQVLITEFIDLFYSLHRMARHFAIPLSQYSTWYNTRNIGVNPRSAH